MIKRYSATAYGRAESCGRASRPLQGTAGTRGTAGRNRNAELQSLCRWVLRQQVRPHGTRSSRCSVVHEVGGLKMKLSWRRLGWANGTAWGTDGASFLARRFGHQVSIAAHHLLKRQHDSTSYPPPTLMHIGSTLLFHSPRGLRLARFHTSDSDNHSTRDGQARQPQKYAIYMASNMERRSIPPFRPYSLWTLLICR